MREKYGKEHFNYLPDTYILPEEHSAFSQHFERLMQVDPRKNYWIVKPANSSRGRGIFITNDMNEVMDQGGQQVVSRYITNPLLINGHKFDLRVYVLVTSMEPLRIYVFKEGLARFASEVYSTHLGSKRTKYQHLTNYSINKKNGNYVGNEDPEADDVGYKWSLTAFCSHLASVGIDMDLLWSRIYDIAIKTVLSGEAAMLGGIRKQGLHRNNCFQLYGFDILVDSDLKPWLIEVNLSPSLATDSPLDMTIKANLIADVLNIVGLRPIDRKKESANKLKNRMRGLQKKQTPLLVDLFNEAVAPQTMYFIKETIKESREEWEPLEEAMIRVGYLKQRDIVRETLEEYERRGNFVRVYPAKGSTIYD